MRCMASARLVRLIVGIALIDLALLGCAPSSKPPSPEAEARLLGQLRNGAAVLDCQSECASAWRSKRAELKSLYERQDWRDLGPEVMQVGFQEDLAYFYLGRSAEGLGAYGASLKYYHIADRLATGPDPRLKCHGSTDLCGGLRLPADIYPRLRLIEADLDRNQPEAVRRPPKKPGSTSTGSTAQRGNADSQSPIVPAEVPATDESWVDPPPVTR